MNREEFHKWVNEHAGLFPKVAHYLADEVDGESRRDAWRSIVGHLDYSAAKQASLAVAKLTGRDKPFSPEEHPGCVLAQALAASQAKPVRYYDGQKGYKCKFCDFDNGYVTCWNFKFLRFFLNEYTDNNLDVPADWKARQSFHEWRVSKPRFKGNETIAVVCNCSKRRQIAAEKGEPIFSDDRFCIYRHGDLQNLNGWLESRSNRFSEFDQFNEAGSF